MTAASLWIVLLSVPDALVSESSTVCCATPTRVLIEAASEAVSDAAAEAEAVTASLILVRAPITSNVKQT